jgi:hypothetical protein
MAIKFEDKPNQAVIDVVKEAGYRPNPAADGNTTRLDPANTVRCRSGRKDRPPFVCGRGLIRKAADHLPGTRGNRTAKEE